MSVLWRSSRTCFLTNHSVCLAPQSRWELLPTLIWGCRPEDYLPTNSYCLQNWQMKKKNQICLFSPQIMFLLSLDKRHLGTVPRFWKQRLSRQELRSLKCAFFFCPFLPVSLLSLSITSVPGPMPNSSALTPQYTQAHTAEQCKCNVPSAVVSSRIKLLQTIFVYRKNHSASKCYLWAVHSWLETLHVFPEKWFCRVPSWI